ncbi:MAG: response regulator [Pseudomonadota bacterium]
MNGVAQTGKQQKVVVVDDNPASLYSTSRILRSAGFEVIECSTGTEALAAADKDVGLIVLDINLPDIDGLEVCRRLRARSNTTYLPIVHLTATFVGSADYLQGLTAGGDSYLTHPVDPPVLIATVRALLFARQADAVRRSTDVRFRAVFELASSGIALFDSDLIYQDVNPEFCKIAGRERGDIIGKACIHLIAPGHEDMCKILHKTLENGGRWEGTLPVARPDGSVADVEWRIAADNTHGARIAIATNITERERLLASERAARTEAERSNRLKDEFLATLSHELRNPLNAMLGWASVLKRKNVTPAMLTQGLDAIERNSRVQSHLIEDLLDFAGIRFGKMRIDLDAIVPATSVESAVEVVSTQAQHKGVEIKVHIADREAYVFADDSRLQQVVWNLLSNAIKFTPAGGRINVVAQVAGEHYEIAVSDTGRGINPEFLPQIFERFSQQESGTGKSFAGLGIGLTIVKHLVDIQHGTIEVQSEGVGKGATFRVRLPLTAKRPSESPSDQSSRLKRVRVLVVEDDLDARALIARILADVGAQVSDVADAEAAMLHIKANVPDILISDIGMARLDGYQMLRNLRAAGFDATRLPAIALTAFSRLQDRNDAMEAGFQAHLAKPVRAEALIAAVANLVPKK